MAYKISDDCISCGTCEAECPVSAISEGDGKYEISREVHRVRRLRQRVPRGCSCSGVMIA